MPAPSITKFPPPVNNTGSYPAGGSTVNCSPALTLMYWVPVIVVLDTSRRLFAPESTTFPVRVELLPSPKVSLEPVIVTEPTVMVFGESSTH